MDALPASEAMRRAVAAAMAARGVSGRELAIRCGWTQSYVARRLNGRVQWSTDDLATVADVLGAPELLPEVVRQ